MCQTLQTESLKRTKFVLCVGFSSARARPKEEIEKIQKTVERAFRNSAASEDAEVKGILIKFNFHVYGSCIILLTVTVKATGISLAVRGCFNGEKNPTANGSGKKDNGRSLDLT